MDGSNFASESAPSLRVLLVDDAQIILDRLASSLGRIPNVRILGTCKDSNEAIGLIGQLHPDLVVLDVRLNDSDGYDVLQFIRANQLQTVVFMFSNDSSEASRARFAAAGAQQFFDKSLDFSALRSAVQDLVNVN